MLTEDEKKERHRAASRKYYATMKGKEAQRRYVQSERGKAVIQSYRDSGKKAEWNRKYNAKEDVKERVRIKRKEFRNTEEGRDFRNAERKRLYRRSLKHATNSRNPWSKEEVELILRNDITDFELSKKIGRTVQAIQVKRAKLKKAKLV